MTEKLEEGLPGVDLQSLTPVARSAIPGSPVRLVQKYRASSNPGPLTTNP
jgi:hypothetical protein